MILLALLLAAAPRVVYVKAGRLFDGLSESYKQNVALKIENDRIAATNVSIPPGARVIDLSNATVLPGLIDCHVHLESRADHFEDIWTFKTSPLAPAMTAVVHARRTLEAGFTTVRDVGSEPFLAADLRDLINEGYFPGPRIVASGPCISITGGHCDLNHYPPNVRVDLYPLERDFHVADGADQLRHVIRAHVQHGVDVIKVAASGGVFSRGDTPGAPQFTYEELRVAVEEAHKAGRRIAAHAHGTQSIKDAILAATAWAAELLDRQKDVGTVQAGRYADLIAVRGDPLKDVHVLERVPFVMKGGAVIKDELSATSAGPASSSSSR